MTCIHFSIPLAFDDGWLDVLTWVLSFNPVKSRVVPEGTATLERTIVAQEVLDLLAEAAPFEPEKVQLAARSSMLAALVTRGAGAATGLARVQAMPQAASKRLVRSIAVIWFEEC